MTPLEIPQFIIRSESGLRRLSLVGQTSWILGRSKNQAIWINDPWASRRHAQLELVQNQYFCLTDLDSRNGTLLNGLPINKPTRLNHGDRISIGGTELEFVHPFAASSKPVQLGNQPQVLMLHNTNAQGKIWQAILQSQGIAVHWHPSHQPIEAELSKCEQVGQGLPQILFLDVAAYPANPYALCRWCSETYPQIQVVLLNSTQCEVMPTERHWALKQGCFGLLPALPEVSLLQQVDAVQQHLEVILEALHLPLSRDGLVRVLTDLDRQLTQSSLSEEGEHTMLSKQAIHSVGF